MLVKTFENIRKNISKIIVKLNLKQGNDLYCIIIWSKKCRGNIFLISLPDKTENSHGNSSQLRVIIESV